MRVGSEGSLSEQGRGQQGYSAGACSRMRCVAEYDDDTLSLTKYDMHQLLVCNAGRLVIENHCEDISTVPLLYMFVMLSILLGTAMKPKADFGPEGSVWVIVVTMRSVCVDTGPAAHNKAQWLPRRSLA